ncbi:MAG: peptidylprolyl isomerase [Bacteroidetes bacterium]|nr:peptidylprolyl isomerase [Bacteroidota bacterium]
MKNLLLIPFGMTVLFSFSGCGTSSSGSGPDSGYPIATYSGKTLSSVEIKRELLKNSPSSLSDTGLSEKSINEFVNRYIEYKLKVADGNAKGYGNDSTLLEEFKSYKKNLAQARVIDGKIKKNLIEELYNRKKQMVKASHLLVMYNEAKNGPDTTGYYGRIMIAKEEIKKGLDFAEAVRRFSDEPNAKQTAGDLGWFSGGDMVYPFENAAYNAPIDSVFGPIKTQFGYHLIKVTARKTSSDPRYISHLMLMFGEGKDTVSMRTRIDSISTAIQSNQFKTAIFNAMVAKYSEDTPSKINGGSMGEWKPSGRVPEFDEIVFSKLQKAGDISGVVRTKWGFHIVRLDSIGKPATIESQTEALSRIISRQSDRMDSQKKLLFNELSVKNKVKISKTLVDSLVSQLTEAKKAVGSDSVSVPSTVAEVLKGKQNRAIISSKDGNLTTGDFISYCNEKQVDSRTGSLNSQNEKLIQQTLTEFYIDNYIDNLEKYDPDFIEVMTSFKDGLVLFKWMETEIWKPSEPADAELLPLYEESKSDLMWDERGEFFVLTVSDFKMADSLVTLRKGAEKVNDTAKSKKKGSSKSKTVPVVEQKLPASFNELVSLMQANNLIVTIDTVLTGKNDGERASRLWSKSLGTLDLSLTYLDSRPSFVFFNRKVEPSVKSLDEARPELTRIFNERLIEKRQSDLISSLKNSANIVIDEKAISRFVKENKTIKK